MSQVDSKTRFTDRVDDYVKARPGYLVAVIETLRRSIGLAPSWRVADVGAGTGISSKLFLDAGCDVTAVEPNDAMRAAAQKMIGANGRFRAVKGTAEATTLADRSVDLVVAAQAFHWFDRVAFRREAMRILRPDGYLALIWNDRLLTGTPFLDAYEQLLQTFGTDYKNVTHRNLGDADVASFFAPAKHETFRCPSLQRFDFDGLKARLLSSSYAPNTDSPRCEPMLAELRRLFDATQQGGVVEMLYETQVFFARVS